MNNLNVKPTWTHGCLIGLVVGWCCLSGWWPFRRVISENWHVPRLLGTTVTIKHQTSNIKHHVRGACHKEKITLTWIWGDSRCPNPRKGDFQICFGGNGACPNLRKSAVPDLFGGKWNMSGFRQKCIARSVWGNWVSLDLRKSVFQDLFGGNLGLSGSQKKKIG